jgi:hypothetical protein
MSLIRKQTTEAMAAANRANSQLSTGPVTRVRALQARVNALQYGLWADPTRAIPQLGEKEEDLRELRALISREFRPRDPMENDLINQMVENRWRRKRVTRTEMKMVEARQLQFDLDQCRAVAAESRTSFSAGEARLAEEKGLASLQDSSHKFRFILQCFEAVRGIVESEGFIEAGMNRLQAIYGPEPGLAGASLLATYRECGKATSESSVSSNEEGRARQADFLALLESEMSSFQILQQIHEISQNELASAVRETLHILPSEDLNRILRSKESLDREYERLLKQLQEHRQHRAPIYSKIETGKSKPEARN